MPSLILAGGITGWRNSTTWYCSLGIELPAGEATGKALTVCGLYLAAGGTSEYPLVSTWWYAAVICQATLVKDGIAIWFVCSLICSRRWRNAANLSPLFVLSKGGDYPAKLSLLPYPRLLAGILFTFREPFFFYFFFFFERFEKKEKVERYWIPAR